MVIPTRIALVAAAAAFTACMQRSAPPPMPSVVEGWFEEGEASWYGPGFHGNQTASGEIYDMDALTAAHRELPFGARLRVRNLDNDRETLVRVNDRGPFARGRILDLSRAAARELAMIGPGTARVRIEVVEGVAERPAGGRNRTPVPEGCHLVQVAAYTERRNAMEMERRLQARGETVQRSVTADGVIRILIGPLDTAEETALKLDHYDGILRPCDP